MNTQLAIITREDVYNRELLALAQAAIDTEIASATHVMLQSNTWQHCREVFYLNPETAAQDIKDVRDELNLNPKKGAGKTLSNLSALCAKAYSKGLTALTGSKAQVEKLLKEDVPFTHPENGKVTGTDNAGHSPTSGHAAPDTSEVVGTQADEMARALLNHVGSLSDDTLIALLSAIKAEHDRRTPVVLALPAAA